MSRRWGRVSDVCVRFCVFFVRRKCVRRYCDFSVLVYSRIVLSEKKLIVKLKSLEKSKLDEKDLEKLFIKK